MDGPGTRTSWDDIGSGQRGRRGTAIIIIIFIVISTVMRMVVV